MARTEGVANSSAPYLCKDKPTDSRCGVALPEFEPGQPFDLGRNCGGTSLQVCNSSSSGACAAPNSVNCVLCKAQLQAVSEIIPTFDAIAKTFVQIDYDYQKFYYTSDSKTTSAQVPQWIQDFCTSKEIGDKCCVGLYEKEIARNIEDQQELAKSAARNAAKFGVIIPIPPLDAGSQNMLDAVKKCSLDVFSAYRPNVSGNNVGIGTVNNDVLKDIYMPAIKAYTNNIDFIEAAAKQYQGVLSSAYLTYIATLPPSASREAWNAEAQRNGWILAGMYYMQITQKSANLLPSTDNIPAFKFAGVVNPDTDQSPESIRDDRNNINAMPKLFKYIDESNSSDDSDIATAALSEITEASGSSMSGMLTQFMHDISGSPGELAENPLYNISLWGYRMMITVQLVFVLTVVITSLMAGLTAANFLVIGTGMTSTPWYEAFKAAWGLTSPFLMLAMSGLFSIGAVLGIYLPLIPYTIFLMGAVGWLMATIEAMVAGPIIALGILSPSGQHELLGKSEPAVMIIFNLILRPALMVFGMMASMLVAVVVVTMINQGFAKVAFNIIRAPGLVEGIFFMMAYTSLLVTALSKVFSLIHVIPEKVLTYIGGQAISYGEGEGLQGMKQGMEGGASGMSSAGKEAGGAPAAGITKNAQDKAHEEHESRGEGVKATRGGRNTSGGNAPQAPPPPP